MHHKEKTGWVKHLDFIIIDIICLQLAYMAAFFVRHGGVNPYNNIGYRSVALILTLTQIIITVFGNNFKNVLRRGFYNEFMATLKQAVLIALFGIFYLFLMKDGGTFSRMTMLLTAGFYLLVSYIFRLVWKKIVRKRHERMEGNRSLIILTTSDKADRVVERVQANKFHHYQITGLVLLDEDHKGETLYGLEVVANASDVVDYVCRSWVDEVFIHVEKTEYLSQEMVDAFNEMGVTTHLKLQGLENPYHREQSIQKLVGYSVLTYSVVNIPENKLLVKRLMDIIGGIVGCILCGILVLFLGPAIYIASPGPIFFSQTRIGQNGKQFKIYKFRSMYMDAEERKKELMTQNEVADGMMFKMEDDPRIIKGVGHFIRKTSLDEFPQFFNVLKGDMSLVGTRPPTVDEWVKYDLHHRLRMATRPGITGMWQVSGRSNIKEFEEVVKLDAEYISKWNLGLDIKIILMTIAQVFKGSGAR